MAGSARARPDAARPPRRDAVFPGILIAIKFPNLSSTRNRG
jgi:hypothetical protein